MKECDYCDQEFEGKEALHIHWLEKHESELNSHEKDDAKKSKRERKEREKQVQQRRKKYLYQGVGAAVVLIIGVVLGPQLVNTIVPSETQSVNITGEPVLGSENASVTVVEYGDFQCPACSNFEQGTFSQIKTEYIDTGKAKFVWKDYPLNQIHEWAESGASAMECVYREDEEAFWNVKSTLFQQQRTLNLNNVEGNIAEWAKQEGVNSTEVKSCIENGNTVEEVRKDLGEGQANGVTSTPSVFVNGDKVGISYNEISQAIDQELEN